MPQLKNRNDLITLGQRMVEHAPPAVAGPPGLRGWNGRGIDVCDACASRIIGRGCDLKQLASQPVWDPDTIDCDLCTKSERIARATINR